MSYAQRVLDLHDEPGMFLAVVFRDGEGQWWNVTGQIFSTPNATGEHVGVAFPESVDGSGQYGPIDVPEGSRAYTIWVKPDDSALDFATAAIYDSGDVPPLYPEDAAELSAGSTASSDFDDEAVPPARTFKLVESSDDDEGLVGAEIKKMRVGESPKFAVDFGTDLTTNARISTVNTPTVISVDGSDDFADGGITFGTTGREDSQAKVTITGVTAGEYVIEFKVLFVPGGWRTGRVTLNVLN